MHVVRVLSRPQVVVKVLKVIVYRLLYFELFTLV